MQQKAKMICSIVLWNIAIIPNVYYIVLNYTEIRSMAIMNTKNICRRLYLLLTCFVLCCTITQMSAKSESAGKWENEYKAYGRTIKVDVDISVPGKDKMPFLAIKPMNDLSSDETDRFQKFIDTLDKNVENKITNRRNTIVISYRDHKLHPDLSDAEKVTTPYRTLLEYDRNKAYAENNELTINEAENLVNRSIQAVLPTTFFQVQDIIVNDRTQYRKSKKKLTDKGYYEMYCLQEIDGILIAGSIHDVYKNNRTPLDHAVSLNGTAYVNATDQNNYWGTYTLWNKTAELGTSDQLLSFDDIKPAIEEMIMSGNIRNIYHVYFGYAQYDMPEGGKYEYILAPAWVIWADFLATPEEEPETEVVNGTGAYMECGYYGPIIANAITGEVTNPLDESEDRMLLPAACMKFVEDY